MSIYFAKINEMDVSDLDDAKKISKSDRLIFITDANGTMSCFLYPLLRSLKMEPEFLPLDDEVDDISMAFIIGTKCANVNGNINIIAKGDTVLGKLDGYSIVSDKTNIKLNVVESIGEAIELSKGKKKPAVEKKEKIEEISEQIKIAADDISKITSDYETEIQENEEPVTHADSDDELPSASKEFIAKLNLYDNNDHILINNADAICSAVVNAASDPERFLSFQIGMLLDDDFSEVICPMIEKHFKELYELATL